MKISVLLTRSPLLVSRKEWMLRYLAYKDSIERAHTRSLDSSFYFKQGTLALKVFDKNIDETGYAKTVKTTSDTHENDLFKYPISLNDLQRSEIDQFQAIAATEPDQPKQHNDPTRLEESTLYLLFKNGNSWVFPSIGLDQGQFLHEAAQKCVREVCGEQINHWLVGKIPVAHDADAFYMKSRFLTGQVQSQGVEHAWLSRQEIKEMSAVDSAVLDAL